MTCHPPSKPKQLVTSLQLYSCTFIDQHPLTHISNSWTMEYPSDLDPDEPIPTIETPERTGSLTAQGPSSHISRAEPTLKARTTLTITDQHHSDLVFSVPRASKMSGLISLYCHSTGRNSRSTRFLFNEKRIVATDTPESVCMLADFQHYVTPTNGNDSCRWETTKLLKSCRNKLAGSCCISSLYGQVGLFSFA